MIVEGKGAVAPNDKMDEPQNPITWLREEVDADAKSPAAPSTQ